MKPMSEKRKTLFFETRINAGCRRYASSQQSKRCNKAMRRGNCTTWLSDCVAVYGLRSFTSIRRVPRHRKLPAFETDGRCPLKLGGARQAG